MNYSNAIEFAQPNPATKAPRKCWDTSQRLSPAYATKKTTHISQALRDSVVFTIVNSFVLLSMIAGAVQFNLIQPGPNSHEECLTQFTDPKATIGG